MNSNNQEIMESEINILEGSPILEKKTTIKEIIKKFNITINHIHNPCVKDSSKKKEFDDNREITIGMGIHFSGKPEKVFEFLDYAFG